jgi:diamine N-acetyltransferase
LKVKPEQASFVASNAYSLAQVAYEEDCVPRAIYVDETMVGFLMYWHLPPATIYHISRLMIDAAYQGQGYGRGVLECLIDLLKAHDDCEQIEITYHPANTQARQLYLSLGFAETSEIEDGELVALLNCCPINV